MDLQDFFVFLELFNLIPGTEINNITNFKILFFLPSSVIFL